MPIDARSLGRAAQEFADYLNELLAHTITRARLVVVSYGDRLNRSYVEFRQRFVAGARDLPVE